MAAFTPITETVFTWAAPPLKFGFGAITEIGDDLRGLGVRRPLILTDSGVPSPTGTISRRATPWPMRRW